MRGARLLGNAPMFLGPRLKGKFAFARQRFANILRMEHISDPDIRYSPNRVEYNIYGTRTTMSGRPAALVAFIA